MKQKSENRKALPKFILVMLGSLLLGALIGIAVITMDGDWTDGFAALLQRILIAAAPYLLWTSALVSALGVFLCHRKAKARFAVLQEDDEAALEEIDGLLNSGLLINSICLILAYFLVGIPFCFMAEMGPVLFLICMAGFVACLAVMVVGQQKIVDFTKKLYPEKRGSVYDVKFQKKWFDTCDEAERAAIGTASYASYKATNTACLVLWLAMVIGTLLFDIGLMPIAVVTVIWLVSTVSYCVHAMRSGKQVHHPNTQW